RLRQTDKANDLFHGGYFFPGHVALCVTHLPGLSVTYLPGSNREHWIGFLDEFPDYFTQGESFGDLKEHLAVLYRDLSSGEIPFVRRRARLELAWNAGT